MPLRQVVRFSDGSRYLFVARTVQRRSAAFGEPSVMVSIMLACDVLHADRTVYARGLDLDDPGADTLVGTQLPALSAAGLRQPPGRGDGPRARAGRNPLATGAVRIWTWRGGVIAI